MACVVLKLISYTRSYNFNKFDAATGAAATATTTPGGASASASAHVTMVGSYENIFGYVYCWCSCVSFDRLEMLTRAQASPLSTIARSLTMRLFSSPASLLAIGSTSSG